MTKHASGYIKNSAYSQEDWDEVSDNPEMTDAEIAELSADHTALPPALLAALKNRGGRPKSAAPKVPLTIRIDPKTIAAYKATGMGWQTRMNMTLRKGAAALMRRKSKLTTTPTARTKKLRA